MPAPWSLAAPAALLVALLTLAASPADAQQARAGGGTRTSSERALQLAHEEERLVREMESIARRLDQDELPSADRERLVERLANLMLSLSELQAQSGRHGMRLRSEVKGVEGPAEVERAKVIDHSRRLMVSEQPRWAPRGWVGLNLSGPHSVRIENGEQFVRFLEYPQVVSVDPSSPADRAGVRRGDTLVAYNGVDVLRELPMGRLLVPETKLAVRLRRDGDAREVTLTVARTPQNVVVRRFDLKFPEASAGAVVMVAPAPSGERRPTPVRTPAPAASARASAGAAVAGSAAPAPIAMHFGGNALLGARLEPLSRELQEATGLPAGMLVLEVAHGSPAFVSGLRSGDVIVAAAGREVQGMPSLRGVLRTSERREVELTIRRKQASRKVTLRW